MAIELAGMEREVGRYTVTVTDHDTESEGEGGQLAVTVTDSTRYHVPMKWLVVSM